MKVSFVSGRSLKNVKRISMVRSGGDAADDRIRHVFVREGGEPDDVMKVTIVRPGVGVVKRLRVEQHLGGRKKQTGILRPVGKGIRRLVLREAEIATNYLQRHDLSNRSKSNGWVKDLPRNVSRAFRVDD